MLAHGREGVILADDTGLGKTFTTLVALKTIGWPAVVVAPNYLKHTWITQGAKHLGIDVFPLSGTKPPTTGTIQPEDGLVVINYEILYAWLPYLKGARSVTFDEGHVLIGEKSRRGQACRGIAAESEYKFVLTATPITSKVKNLWNLVDTISPGRFGKFFKYALRYCNAHQVEIEFGEDEKKLVWNYSGSSHLDELNARLKRFMIRHTKADVQLEIPPKIRQVVEVDVPLEAMTDDWSLANTNKAHRALVLSAQGKVEPTCDLAVERLNEGHSVVIFVHEKHVARLLEKRFSKLGIQTWMATGDQSAKKRIAHAEEAQKRSPSVLIATIDAMGAGVDLSYASVVIFCELHYVPALLLQAEGRSHRFGQRRDVLVYYMIGKRTIDEKIKEVILSRLGAFEEAIGDLGDKFIEEFRGQSPEDAIAELGRLLLERDKSELASAEL